MYTAMWISFTGIMKDWWISISDENDRLIDWQVPIPFIFYYVKIKLDFYVYIILKLRLIEY